MIDRSHLREIDWILIGLLLVNTAIGIVLIYSASHYLPGQFYARQLLWLAVSLGALFLALSVDYKVLVGLSPYLFALLMVVLAGLLVFGRIVGGAKSWIFHVSFMGGQPSELAKIVLILLLARIFAEFRQTYVSLDYGMLAAGAALVPMALIALQPDMGTAMCLAPILLGGLVLAGLNKKTIALVLLVALVAGFGGWHFFLKDYQKKRLTTLVNPGQDPRGSGYQILQSKIAIGSGGLAGKGFKKGTQSQLRFLPARHTDFVFSVLGEEFGFLGVLTVFAVYFLFLARLFGSVGRTRDRMGMYIIFMVACLLTFEFAVNVMMIIGLFPVTGIPLPLLSYGGTSLLTTYLAVGLVLNAKMRRFANA